MSPGTRPLLLLFLFCAQSATVSLAPVEDFTEDKEAYGTILPPKKPGTCPKDVDYPKCEGSMSNFKHECKLDEDCEEKRKCCFSGCRRRCLLPLGAKTGDCPYFNNTKCMLIKPSPSECGNNNQCQGTDRCCNYGCRNQCMPTMKVKPGQCPIPLTRCASTPPPPLCHSDSECTGKKKCCIKFCRKECYDPRP